MTSPQQGLKMAAGIARLQTGESLGGKVASDFSFTERGRERESLRTLKVKVDLPQVKDGPIYSRLLRRLSAQVSAEEGFFDTVHDGDRCDRVIRGPVSNKTSSGARARAKASMRPREEAALDFHLRRSISAKIFQLTDWKVDSFEKWLQRM